MYGERAILNETFGLLRIACGLPIRRCDSPAGAERSSALGDAILWLLMPTLKRHFVSGQLQFLTSSTYRRAQLFASERFCRDFVEILGQVRSEMSFQLIGWVLMPEHFHLLIWPDPAETTSLIMQELKKRTAQRILAALQQDRRHPWCHSVLAQVRLPPSVHSDSEFRVWQRRFYPFGIYSEKKRLEKLHYMHGNPVKRGLVNSPDQWPWSSFRFYYLNDSSLLAMDRMR